MNTFTPILIALAVSTPLILLMGWLHWKASRNDRLKLKVLRILLWCVVGLVFAQLAALFIFKGTTTHSNSSSLFSIGVLWLVFANIVFQIVQCKRRLGQK